MARVALTAKMGAIWIQPAGANNPTYYLDCKDMGDLAEGEGAETLLQCFDASGVGWETVGSTVAPPDPIAFDITGLMFASLDWLETIACPFTIYVLQRQCGRADNWSNYVRGFVIQRVSRQTKTYSNLVARDTDAESTLAAALQAYPPMLKIVQVDELKKTVPAGQTLAYNAIAMNTDLRCLGGGCGDEMDPGERGMAVGDAAAGQGQAVETSDDGDTWTAVGAAAILGAAQNITAVVRFPYGRTGARYIVMGNPGGGGQGLAAYSDDRGATFSATINVGGAATDEAAEYGNALFALDERHIWCVGSTLGEVNFSEDGGETWTTQEDGALLASTGYCIHFELTGQYGFAGGAADAMMLTTDGGSAWVAATGNTGTGAEILCCQVLDSDRIWVGTDDGELWYSRDFGVTWAQRTGWPGSGAGEVKSLAFFGDHVGYMAYNDGSNVGHINYTFDGGYTWERLTGAVLTAQLNHVIAIDETHAWAVGEPDAGPLGVIVEVLPA